MIVSKFPLVALSDFQRTEIALRYEAVITKKAKERQLSCLKKGQNTPLVSIEHNGESYKTRDEIAKIAGTSGATVMRTKFILETVMEIKGVSVLATCRNSKGSPYNGHPPQLEK